MDRAKLLIVEDDDGLSRQYRWSFPEYEIFAAQTRQAAWSMFASERPPVVLLDLGLPPDPAGVSEGLALLREMLAIAPGTKIVVATASGDIRSALEAVSIGAHDFFHKPVDIDVLRVILDRAYHMWNLECENRRIRGRPGPSAIEQIITGDDRMLRLCSSIRRLASADLAVLIFGESGTGKEILARALHELGPRAEGPFVAVDCAAIPEMPLESELFGCGRGALAGAAKQSMGKIESAHRGTLFLDEIDDLPPRLQAKLLRFLQDQIIDRSAGPQPIEIDVRIVCATNQDLKAKMREGLFSEDLFYRLNEITLRVPPLRERSGDPVLLANFFLHKFKAQFGRRIRGYTADAISGIAAHRWPGNVRELENRVKRGVVMSESGLISAADLELTATADDAVYLDIRSARMQAEREVLKKALTQTRGTISKAAKLLGISRPTLYSLLEVHGLETGSARRQVQATGTALRLHEAGSTTEDGG